MKIQKLILSAARANHDTIAITPCGDGTLIKSYASGMPGDMVGGGDILSAGGSSSVQMLPESFMDVFDSISSDDVHGLMSVGWLVNASHNGLVIFENPRAGGRRHGYHDKIAAYREKLRRVA